MFVNKVIDIILDILKNGYVNNIKNFFFVYNIEYIVFLDVSEIFFEGNCLDFCVLINILEYILVDMIVVIWWEMYWILKLGGIILVKIDYFDYYFYIDNIILKLNFLCYSVEEWWKYNYSNYY